MSNYQEYRQTKRGSKGVLTLKANDKVGKLVSVRAVVGDEDLMVITTNGTVIRTPLDQVKIAGRNTQGVHIMKLEGKQKVSSITIVPHEEYVEDEVMYDEEGNPIVNENVNEEVSSENVEVAEVKNDQE